MHIGKRAVVIGAGIGGLTAARALVGKIEKIVILERDVLSATIEPRAGVPQGRHPHVLLPGGLEAIDDLFDGFSETMRAGGAKFEDIGVRFVYEFPGQPALPERTLGPMLLKASRPMIEGTVRNYLQREPDIEILDGRRVTEIVPSPDGKAVTAVRCISRDGTTETYEADLIVDASGRGEPTLAFLRATGRTTPQETTIGVDFAYSTAVVEFEDDHVPDFQVMATMPDAPESSRLGLILSREDKYWCVGLGGRGKHAPPADWQSFVDFAAMLPTRSIHAVLAHAKPQGKVTQFQFPESRRRHFERYDDWPRGLVPFADTICRFNPVYGQGMTAASKEAVVLRDLLESRQSDARPLDGLFEAFMETISPMLDNIWMLSAVPDLAYPDTRGERPDNLDEALQFNIAIHRAAYLDADIQRRLMNVISLLKPASEIQSEEVVEEVKRLAAEFGAAQESATAQVRRATQRD